MSYRLVAFDFDGVLADSADWLLGVVPQVCRTFGLREVGDAEIQEMRGLPSREVVRRMGVPLWRLPAIGAHMRRLSRDAAGQIPLFAGVDGLLSQLRAQGVLTAVVTSNGRETVRAVLGDANVANIDHFICGVGLFGKAGRLRALNGLTGVAPAQAAYVGDETRDIDAARKAGWAAVAVEWGYATADVLRDAGPDAFVDTFAGLGEALCA